MCQLYQGCTVNSTIKHMHMKTKSGSACFKMSGGQTHGQHKIFQCTHWHKNYKPKHVL